MNNGIIITINLQGRIGGSVAHTETQSMKVNVTTDPKRPLFITKDILHNDRPEHTCYKRVRIQGEVVDSWVNGSSPSFVDAKVWRKLNRPIDKIKLYVATFDEGYGVEFEEV